MALAAYATEHGGITMLTANQLEIARKVIAALEPIEEITKMISNRIGININTNSTGKDP